MAVVDLGQLLCQRVSQDQGLPLLCQAQGRGLARVWHRHLQFAISAVEQGESVARVGLPASSLLQRAHTYGAQTVIVNLEPLQTPNPAYLQDLLEKAWDVLPALFSCRG